MFDIKESKDSHWRQIGIVFFASLLTIFVGCGGAFLAFTSGKRSLEPFAVVLMWIGLGGIAVFVLTCLVAAVRFLVRLFRGY